MIHLHKCWFLLLFSTQLLVLAQDEPSGSNIIKDLEYFNIIKNADELFKNNEYADAIYYYEQANKLRPDDVQLALKLGICIVNGGKIKAESIPYLKKAVGEGIHSANFYLGKAYHYLGNFELALYCYNVYKLNSDKTEQKKLDLDRAIAQTDTAKRMYKTPLNVKIKNCGSNINTDESEYAPLLTADKSELYFTSRREGSRGTQKEPNGQYFEDIWNSTRTNGTWAQAQNAGESLNSSEHDALLTLTPDGSEAIIYRSDPYSGEDILFSIKKSGKNWGPLLRLSSTINSTAQELSATFSADAQTLIFSSNRKGGFGGFDLYRAERKKNGVFGPAVNLGPKINTPYDEESPFLHANGSCLYFSSKGHNCNMGGFDIFRSCLTDSSTWSQPVNLGYPINTTDDDLYFALMPDMRTAYFSGVRADNYGGFDLYEILIDADTSGLTMLKGLIVDAQASNKLSAEIEILQENGLKQTVHSNAESGQFMSILHSNKNYTFRVTFGNQSETFNVTSVNSKAYRIIEKEIRFGY